MILQAKRVLYAVAVILSALFCFVSVSDAAREFPKEKKIPQPQCYSRDDYAAEQMIRFQTQLMVIGMMCRDRTGGDGKPNSYDMYRNFSREHELVIRRYEQRLITTMGREHVADPEKKLHELRTRIANVISQYAMGISPGRFCKMFMTRLDRASELSDAYLEKLAYTVSSEQESSRPLCSMQKNGMNR